MLVVEAIKHREILVRNARSVVGDDAEDVIQNLIEYLLRAKIPTTERTPLRLLNYYVKLRCYSHIRTKKKRIAREDVYSTGIMIDEVVDEELNDKQQFLDKALREIHPYARELLNLKYVNGKTTVEISEQTGINITRIRHIMTCAKQIIQEYYDYEKRRN